MNKFVIYFENGTTISFRDDSKKLVACFFLSKIAGYGKLDNVIREN